MCLIEKYLLTCMKVSRTLDITWSNLGQELAISTSTRGRSQWEKELVDRSAAKSFLSDEHVSHDQWTCQPAAHLLLLYWERKVFQQQILQCVFDRACISTGQGSKKWLRRIVVIFPITKMKYWQREKSRMSLSIGYESQPSTSIDSMKTLHHIHLTIYQSTREEAFCGYHHPDTVDQQDSEELVIDALPEK